MLLVRVFCFCFYFIWLLAGGEFLDYSSNAQGQLLALRSGVTPGSPGDATEVGTCKTSTLNLNYLSAISGRKGVDSGFSRSKKIKRTKKLVLPKVHSPPAPWWSFWFTQLSLSQYASASQYGTKFPLGFHFFSCFSFANINLVENETSWLMCQGTQILLRNHVSPCSGLWVSHGSEWQELPPGIKMSIKTTSKYRFKNPITQRVCGFIDFFGATCRVPSALSWYISGPCVWGRESKRKDSSKYKMACHIRHTYHTKLLYSFTCFSPQKQYSKVGLSGAGAIVQW